MPDPEADDRDGAPSASDATAPWNPTRNPGRRRASAIYGTIITAAVLASGGDALSTEDMAFTVVVTIVVYWIAEQYADLLGEHTHRGRLPSRRTVLVSLENSWPMVTSSFFPLVVLLVAWAVGASSLAASEWALLAALLLLVVHGHAAGRAAGLRGFALIGVTLTAALLGVVMVILKTFLQRHHEVF